MPAVVEADDLGTYVLKFRGAGQGPKALVLVLSALALFDARLDSFAGAGVGAVCSTQLGR